MGQHSPIFSRMNLLPLCFVILFASPSLTIKKLQLPPIPLSIFHLPPQFQPFQFLDGLKSAEIDSSVDTSQFPPILQTILGGVAMVADQFPFIKGMVVFST